MLDDILKRAPSGKEGSIAELTVLGGTATILDGYIRRDRGSKEGTDRDSFKAPFRATPVKLLELLSKTSGGLRMLHSIAHVAADPAALPKLFHTQEREVEGAVVHDGNPMLDKSGEQEILDYEWDLVHAADPAHALAIIAKNRAEAKTKTDGKSAEPEAEDVRPGLQALRVLVQRASGLELVEAGSVVVRDLGTTLGQLHRFQEAHEAHQTALALHQQTGDTHNPNLDSTRGAPHGPAPAAPWSRRCSLQRWLSVAVRKPRVDIDDLFWQARNHGGVSPWMVRTLLDLGQLELLIQAAQECGDWNCAQAASRELCAAAEFGRALALLVPFTDVGWRAAEWATAEIMIRRGEGDEALAMVRPDAAERGDGYACARYAELAVMAGRCDGVIKVLTPHRFVVRGQQTRSSLASAGGTPIEASEEVCADPLLSADNKGSTMANRPSPNSVTDGRHAGRAVRRQVRMFHAEVRGQWASPSLDGCFPSADNGLLVAAPVDRVDEAVLVREGLAAHVAAGLHDNIDVHRLAAGVVEGDLLEVGLTVYRPADTGRRGAPRSRTRGRGHGRGAADQCRRRRQRCQIPTHSHG
ncbi:hypothetical protein ABT275_45620 [Streptomyces sp. NPDC001185]|uniref:hypothetical protein n=1 Tax=Streptomyces sp. NPDC001185 TaxID=3154380 RepID=UPI00332BDA37